MEIDYQKMYNNLTVLLQDICQFLSSDKLGALSHRDKKLVESLITRSKVQLQEIAKIEMSNEEYVDMDVKKVSVMEEEEEKPEIYSSVDDINKNVDNVEMNVNEEIICPYIGLPAKDVDQKVKSGEMSMRRKFLLGFEKMKRVYGAIHNRWLLIYYTERDAKPICTFYLKHYEARESDGPKSTNFELMSSLDRKIYFFMALTPKDMIQWVVHINRCHDNTVVQSKEMNLEKDPSIEDEIGEHYDTITPGSVNTEEDIYLELDDLRVSSQNNNRVSEKIIDYDPAIRPPLPRRIPQKKAIPISPPKTNTITNSSSIIKPLSPHDSNESLASYDDIQELTKPIDGTDKVLSEDDEDETYEAFVHVKNKISKMSKTLPTQDDTKEKDESVVQTTINKIIPSSGAYLGNNNFQEVSYNAKRPTNLNFDKELKTTVEQTKSSVTPVSDASPDKEDGGFSRLVPQKVNNFGLLSTNKSFNSRSPVKPVTPVHDLKKSFTSYDSEELPQSPEHIEEDEGDTYEAFIHVEQKIVKPKAYTIPDQYKVQETSKSTNTENSETRQEAVEEKEKSMVTEKPKEQILNSLEKLQKNHSFIQEFTTKGSRLRSVGNKESKYTNPDAKSSVPTQSTVGRGTYGLSPPAIQKVPVIPVKPKIRDGPSIGKMSTFHTFRQETSDR